MENSCIRTTAGIVLAAGLSRRFGGANKLLANLGGKPVVRWVLDAALAARLGRVVVVVGHENTAVCKAFDDLSGDERLQVVVNGDYADGQSRSVVAGLQAVGDGFSAVMYLMGDQPMVSRAMIDGLIETMEKSGKGLCYPTFKGKRRSPVVFSARYFPAIFALTGDVGARAIDDANEGDAATREFADEILFHDVDRPADLRLMAGKTERAKCHE